MSAPATESLTVHAGLGPLAGRYDGYILDLWGVVHNGLAPYPGAVDCMRRLRRAGKSVILLSNAPRGAAVVRDFLAGIGVGGDAYDDIVTSGDATREALARRADPWHAALGRACLYFGKPDDARLLDGLDYDRVDAVADADFILSLGLDDADTETVADYRERLAAATARKLPMICGNPDLTVMRGDTVLLCAGALAKAYEEIGGEVCWHGKPYPRVYQICLQRMAGVAPERVLAIGDSFRTDIAGANRAGLDSLFALGGIHAEELGLAPGAAPDPAQLEAAIAAGGHRPTAAILGLRW